MKDWAHVVVESEVKIGLVDYLKENAIKFECSDMGDGFYHISVYCDTVEMVLINDLLESFY